MTSEAEAIIFRALRDAGVSFESATVVPAVAAALRDAGMLTAPEWEYGWRAFFANGEEYEWLACASREDAEHEAREYQREEDRGGYGDGHLAYSVWRRRVAAPGPWSPIPEGEPK